MWASSLSLGFTTRAFSPYWLRWASSAMTITLRRSVSIGYEAFSSGMNFCNVVNTTPPEATFSFSCKSPRSSACTGFWRRSSWQAENVPKSWSSRSLRSVMTTSVGFFIFGWRMTFPE